jgi:hypothetical protein
MSSSGPCRQRSGSDSGSAAPITLDPYSHAIPAMQEAAALIAGLVLSQN